MWKYKSIKIKLISPLIFFILLTGIVTLMVVQNNLSKSLDVALKEKGSAVCKNIAMASRDQIIFEDQNKLQKILDDGKKEITNFSYAFITDADNNVLAHTFPDGFPLHLLWENSSDKTAAVSIKLLSIDKKILYDFAVPIFINNQLIGIARLGISQEGVEQSLMEARQSSVITILILIIIGVIITLLISSNIIKPIQTLHKITEDMIKGHFDSDFQKQSVPCWEQKNCREKDCPAYKNKDLACWYIEGTKCNGTTQGVYDQKIEDCKKCKTYRKFAGDEIQQLGEAFHVMANSVRDAKNNLEEKIRVATEDLNKANKELENAVKVAESATHSKSEFLATMSHELRTPLNAVIGFSDILDSIIKDEKQKSFVQSIKLAGKSLLTLINDILDLSKIEANMLVIKPDIVNIKRLISELEQIFRAKIEKKNLEFIIEIEDSIPESLIIDEIRLRQILLNLIGNAEKFTDIGFVKIAAKRINIIEDDSRIDLVISVEDSGIGIPQNDVGKIFEAFKQQEEQNNKKYGGTGLGLTICKKLVTAMDGEISVSSTVGKGSVFEIILKRVAIGVYNNTEVNSDDSLELNNTTFEEAIILVVDDIESNRNMLKIMLEEVNLTVQTAENGKIALEMIEQNRPDLIFMDIKMPIMDGLTATLQIKTNPTTKNIPVVMLTASSVIENKDNYMKCGFNAYMSKPFKVFDLLSTLTRFLKIKPAELKTKTSELDYIFNLDAVENPSQLLNVLSSEILPLCKSLKNVMIMSRIQEFGGQIIKVAEQYSFQPLIQYGKLFISYADSFDTESISNELVKLASDITGLIKKSEGTNGQ